jgi:hypothetical protein
VIRQPMYLDAKNNEQAFRMHVANYFSNAYPIDEWPFAEIRLEKIKAFFYRLQEKFGYHTDERIKDVVTLVAVALVRMNQGFYMPCQLYSKMPAMEPFVTFIKEQQELFREMVDFDLPENWAEEVANTFLFDVYAWRDSESKARAFNDVNTLLDNIIKISEVPMNAEDRKQITGYLTSLMAQYKVVPLVKKMWFHHRHFEEEEMLRMYPIFTAQLLDELKKLEWKRGDYPWFTSCRCLAIEVLFSQWENLIQVLDSRREKVNVVICSLSGRNHARLLKELFEKVLVDNANLYLYEGSLLDVDPDEAILKNSDVIVTTANVKALPQEKVFVIDSIPKENQKDTLYHLVKEKQTENHLTSKRTEKEISATGTGNVAQFRKRGF